MRAVDELRRRQWEEATDWPLTAAALLFLGAYAWPILDPGLSASLRSTCEVVTWVTWAAFAVDYFARIGLSQDASLAAEVAALREELRRLHGAGGSREPAPDPR